MRLPRLLQRSWEIARFTSLWAVERSGRSSPVSRSPARLRDALARLGPIFVKLGQALSLRQDMLPAEYVAALQSLQDHIAPFPTAPAIAEIERSLGRPLDELFASFDVQPLAAASVAQVHAARLRHGREVIVKVRRIGIEREIERDMRALARLVLIATILVPTLRRYEPSRIVVEIWNNLRKEIDFRVEARNIRQFAAAFQEWPSIYVPDVVGSLACESVVVQIRSHGVRIDDPAVRADGPRLAQSFVELYLHQLFVLGVFHGDPHPGNLFIIPDGRICFHDFGLIGRLTASSLMRWGQWPISPPFSARGFGGCVRKAKGSSLA